MYNIKTKNKTNKISLSQLVKAIENINSGKKTTIGNS